MHLKLATPLIVALLVAEAPSKRISDDGSLMLDANIASGPNVPAFFTYLEESSFKQQIPAASPINKTAYDAWKMAVKERNGAVVGDLEYVSFADFVEHFELMMEGIEKQLQLIQQTSAPLVCYMLLYRKGSGSSIDRKHKSNTWMAKMAEHYLTWPSNPTPILKRCFEENSKGALVEDICQSNGTTWNSTTDVILVLEDVSYSGTELSETQLAFCRGSCGLPLRFFISAVYISPMTMDKLESVSLPEAFISPRSIMNRSKPGMNCNMGLKGHEKCWIYFDHKMADDTSLGLVNILAARGAIFDDYEFLWQTRGKNYFNSYELEELFESIGEVKPFILGCEEAHCMSALSPQFESELFAYGQACAMPCPYAPYKDSLKYKKKRYRCLREAASVPEDVARLSACMKISTQTIGQILAQLREELNISTMTAVTTSSTTFVTTKEEVVLKTTSELPGTLKPKSMTSTTLGMSESMTQSELTTTKSGPYHVRSKSCAAVVVTLSVFVGVHL